MIHNKAFDETNPEKDEFRKQWDKLLRLNTKSDEYVSNYIIMTTTTLCVHWVIFLGELKQLVENL